MSVPLSPPQFVPIAREVHVAAAPAEVAAALGASRWRAAVEVIPEGVGSRVRITAVAGPAAVAAALEAAILADVCGVKERLEPPASQPDMVGKSM